jgi:hypothetical protein
MLLNDEYIFEHATNAQILDYMEIYDLSDLNSYLWQKRNPHIKDDFGFDEMSIFSISQPYLNAEIQPEYPNHPRQLKFNAFEGVGKAILKNMLVMSLVGTELISFVPLNWRDILDKDTTAKNIVEAQILHIATTKKVPDLLQRMSKARYESGKRWKTRFLSNEPVSLKKYSIHSRTHDVFKAVIFFFAAGPVHNTNWAIWCGQLFVSIVTALK